MNVGTYGNEASWNSSITNKGMKGINQAQKKIRETRNEKEQQVNSNLSSRHHMGCCIKERGELDSSKHSSQCT